MSEPRKTPRVRRNEFLAGETSDNDPCVYVWFAEQLEIETQELAEALRNLTDRLRLIHEDDRYLAVWTIAQAHLGRYSGPDYVTELEAAEQALARHRAKQGGVE